ncbi:hypothetical protein ABZV64_25375 [Streptomyces sp. NPDC004959]|uniref:hypothetical protein n=1 Tax=unclassified Streptomyces TaxID=2593676 RepID=UPI0004C914F6|nr:hypothetical protein [Streptomyces sp. NRRL F-5630]
MLTANRAMWFIAAFAFALPSMLVMFRDGGPLTQGTWIKSLAFAAGIATIIAITLGRGRP